MSAQGKAPLVSVIVLNYNGAQHLRECLPSIKAQDYPNLEIIVVDNGSTDDSRGVAEEHGVKFVALGGNYGFGYGNNKGAEAASGEFLFFVNNDMRFPAALVSTLAAHIEQDDSLFALDAKQFNWEGTKVIHAGTRFRRGGFLTGTLPFFQADVLVESDCPIEVPWANGATLFCRKRLFDAIGGFDPTFFIDNEDLDLCWRAWLRGWKTVYVPSAYCFHKWGAAFQDSPLQGLKRQRHLTALQWRRRASRAKNLVRFCIKTMDWTMVFKVCLRQAVVATCYLLTGSFALSAAFWRSIVLSLWELPELLRLRHTLKRQSVCTSDELLRRFLHSPTLTVSAPAHKGEAPACEQATRKGAGAR